MKNRTRMQVGLTLVELMVTMAITLMLLIGLTAAFINSLRTYNSQDSLAQLHDSERLVVTVLVSSVRAAGYIPYPAALDPVGQLPAVTGPPVAIAAGQGIAGARDSSTGSDMLATRGVSAAGDGLPNCLGQTNTAAGTQVLVQSIYKVSAKHELLCSIDGGASFTDIVGNVASMTVLYGVDNSGAGGVDRYLTAADVSAGSLWPQVKAARITLRFLRRDTRSTDQPITWVQTVNLMNKP